MEKVKILVVCKEAKVRNNLQANFLSWGMDTVLLEKMPDLETIKELSPQLVFMEKQYYDSSKLLTDGTLQLFDMENKPGLVILLTSSDHMPLTNEVGHISILNIPFCSSELFSTVRQALTISNMEFALDEVLNKLDLIYEILNKELNHGNQVHNAAQPSLSEITMLTDNNLCFGTREEIVSKSKTLILSLIRDSKNNCELSQYEDQLHYLEQYLSKLEQILSPENSEPKPIPELLKTHSLSRKELKIFTMITSGMTTEEIAEKLFISPETVKSHRRNIRKKLSLVGNKVTLGDCIHHLNLHEKSDTTKKNNNLSELEKLDTHHPAH